MKSRVYLRLVSLLLVLTPVAGHGSLLLTTLESFQDAKTIAIAGTPLLSGRLLADFYSQRGYEMAWSDPARVKALLELVGKSQADGFAPSDFHADLLRRMSAGDAFKGLAESERIGVDLRLSDALLRYVHHTRFGKLDPVSVDPKWNDRAPVPESLLIADMNGALAASDLAGFLSSRFQTPFWYQDLKQGFGKYLGAGNGRGLSPLPIGPSLGPGSRGERVALLRERLQLIGQEEPKPPADLELYDETLRATVSSFQRRSGLPPDGVVGPGTLAAINGPADPEKAAQLRINLERMRWLYNDLPPDYVFVDVARYMAHLVRNGSVSWSTRVIVGAKDAQTPMFRDSLDHVVFNPTWTVPISIQKKMGNVSSRYTLVDRQTGHKISGGNAGDYKRYRVVQQAGPGNALGQVKFVFPNRHAVYMHDTPSRGLFGQSSRALSHGCVRVQNPVKLAELVLEASAWDRAKIDRVLGANQTRYVNLSKQLPVLLYYLTARADETGAVNFRPDVYGRDQSVRDALDAPVLSARIAFFEPIPLANSVPDAVTAPAVKPSPDRPEDEEEMPPDVPPSQSGVRLTQAENAMK